MKLREVARPEPLPPDVPRPRFTLRFRDSRAEKSWRVLVRGRRTAMRECWDHLAYRAPEDLPKRCRALLGGYADSGVRQYEVGPKQRVWYVIEGDVVTILEVYRRHPKGTE